MNKPFLGLRPRADLQYFAVWFSLGLLLIAASIYLSLVSVSVLIPMPQQHFDKVYHLLNYAIIMGWFVQIFHGQSSYCLLAAAFILLGIGTEVLQSFHPLRHFDVLDMLANTAGVLVVWGLSRSWPVNVPLLLERVLLRLVTR